MKILMVLTSHDKLGDTGDKTGFWLEEFAAPYYVFRDADAEIVLASPRGGRPPVDPKSEADDAQTDATRRLADDREAQQALSNTARLADVSGQRFDAIFYPGGHGPLWDLAENKDSIELIERAHREAVPLALVCHAPGVLRDARAPDGSPVVAGKSVTGFSNSEEEAVELTDVVPFLLEDMLKERDAKYSRADDWAEHVQRDGNLITGQNPASSAAAAHALLDVASSRERS